MAKKQKKAQPGSQTNYKMIAGIIIVLLGVLSFCNEALLGGYVGFVALLLYFLAVAAAASYSLEGGEKLLCPHNGILYLLLLVICTGFVFAWISRERFVYYWDYGGYWTLSITTVRSMFRDPISTLRTLLDSINHDDYNIFLPVLISLPMKLLGSKFASYVLIVTALFVCPAVFCIALGARRYATANGAGTAPLWLYVTATALLPAILAPVLEGFTDVAGLLTLSLLMVLAFQFDWGKYDLRRCLLIALFLVLTLIQRRYFAFAVVGYILGLCVHFLTNLFFAERSERKGLLRGFFLSMLTIGGVSLSVMLLFFRTFLLRAITNDFAQAYSAYSLGSTMDKIVATAQAIGGIALLLGAVGAVMSLVGTRLRSPDTYMLLVNCIVPALLFFRIQSMGPQHYYIILCPITMLVVAGCGHIAARVPAKAPQAAVSAALILPLALNCFAPASWVSSQFGQAAFGSQRFRAPRIRGDIDVLQQIDTDLRQLVGDSESKVYVAASSAILNDDILRKLNYPDSLYQPSYLYVSSHVDLRDGFPLAFFFSDYVLVADPPQTHLDPASQQTVVQLANEFLEGRPTSTHFEKLNSYTLDGGVTATVYHKLSSFTYEDVEYWIALFDEIYPNEPGLFRDRLMSIIEN